jgi:hypothetical protein
LAVFFLLFFATIGDAVITIANAINDRYFTQKNYFSKYLIINLKIIELKFIYHSKLNINELGLLSRSGRSIKYLHFGKNKLDI